MRGRTSVFRVLHENDTDEAEAGELKAGAEVNPAPRETLQKMNAGPPMMNRLWFFSRAPESFCPSVTTFF